MQVKYLNEEVLYTEQEFVSLSSFDMDFLKKKAVKNRRKRIRLCAHKNLQEAVHEMIIVHTNDAYVRPHKHLRRCESFHVIEGIADVIIYDDKGNPLETIKIGDYNSGRNFYCRIPQAYFHSLIIRSDFLVFHETTQGPFDKTDTVFASWAPSEEDSIQIEAFKRRL